MTRNCTLAALCATLAMSCAGRDPDRDDGKIKDRDRPATEGEGEAVVEGEGDVVVSITGPASPAQRLTLLVPEGHCSRLATAAIGGTSNLLPAAGSLAQQLGDGVATSETSGVPGTDSFAALAGGPWAAIVLIAEGVLPPDGPVADRLASLAGFVTHAGCAEVEVTPDDSVTVGVEVAPVGDDATVIAAAEGAPAGTQGYLFLAIAGGICAGALELTLAELDAMDPAPAHQFTPTNLHVFSGASVDGAAYLALALDEPVDGGAVTRAAGKELARGCVDFAVARQTVADVLIAVE